MLYGYCPVTSGALKVFGNDLAVHLRKIKYRIGVCQQENNLDPDLTVEENLKVFSRFFDIPKKEAEERIRALEREAGTLQGQLQVLRPRGVLVLGGEEDTSLPFRRT